MGKRPRISRSDLPNQERVALLNKFDAAFGAFQRLQERRRACSDEAEKRRINTLLNGYRSEFQQLFAQLKLVDLGCKNNMEALFNNYCESYNVYFGRKLGNYVRDVLQSEEIKKITHLIHTVKNDEERAKLQEYIDNKPQSELNALIKLAVRNYQQNRSDYNRAKTNDFLAYFHKKIECKPYTKASEDEIKATRADFNGFFQIPGVEQLKRYNPYSEAYRDFSRRPSRSRIDISPFSYDFSRSKAWQACCRTTMLSSIEMPLREAMARQGVPPELLPKMKVADFGRILFNEYGKEPYHPGRGNILALEDVVPGLDSRHKAFFWKYNAIPTPEAQKKFCDSLLKHGVSQEYIDVLLPSILNEGRPNPKVDRKKFKGVIPFFSCIINGRFNIWAARQTVRRIMWELPNSNQSTIGPTIRRSMTFGTRPMPLSARRMANSATATSFMKMFWPAMSKIPILLNIWSIRDMTTKMTGSTGPSVWGIRRKTISAER